VIEENALVVATEGKYAWVETLRQNACGQCASQKGCGSATLQDVFGKRDRVLRAVSDIGVKVGDEVVIGVEERALVRGSMLVYAMPLIAMIVCALLGDTLAKHVMSIDADLMSVFGALVGLLFSVAVIRWFSNKVSHNADFQPVVLRHTGNSAEIQTQFSPRSRYKILG